MMNLFPHALGARVGHPRLVVQPNEKAVVFVKREVNRKLRVALDKLVKKDCFLLTNDVNERSISHKLAEHLSVEFKKWDVDCEYNRDGHLPKRLQGIGQEAPAPMDDTEGKTVYPDIIVHKRGNPNKKPYLNNLLVVEVKKASNPDGIDFDRQKLQAFKKELGYRYAASIIFRNTGVKKPYKLKWEE